MDFGDETTGSIRDLFTMVADGGAIVPSLWRLEIANSLTMAVVLKRVDADFRRAALADLALLDIVTDPQTDAHAWHESVTLADAHRLTVNDAAYLELARRRALPLATLDRDLRIAAGSIGLTLLA